MKRILLTITIALVAVPGVALAQGNLYLEKYFENPESGVANAEFYVYHDDGSMIHSGHGAGAYEAGELVEVDEGWYWVEVGLYRTEHNLQHLFVEDERTTIIPTGWVAVSTIAPADQVDSCDHWNAELNAFQVDGEGTEQLVMSNRGTGVSDYGMIQLPVGDFLVYFHSLPLQVTVQAGSVYRFPTGFQDPVVGDRAQLAVHEEGAEDNIVVSLCEVDGIHVPAGDYWLSRIVPTTNYPYEERVWDPVTVAPTNDPGYVSLRAESIRREYTGEGSQPVPITDADVEVLQNYRDNTVVGGIPSSLDGFLPSSGIEL